MIISKVIAFDLSDADINTTDAGLMESFKENIIKQLKLFASIFKGTWEPMDFRNCARAQTPGGGRPTPGRLYTRMIGTGK